MGDAYKWIVFSRAFKIILNKWPLKKKKKTLTILVLDFNFI